MLGSDAWVVIPARGGSKGIPRKNMRLLGGRPLVGHVLDELASTFPKDRVVVSTDDPEIERYSIERALIHGRSTLNASDSASLDEVAVEVAEWLLRHGANPGDVFVTVQPTSPLLKARTVLQAIGILARGVGSVLSVRDDRHLRWSVNPDGEPQPLFSQRLNRQLMTPTFAETGGVVCTRIRDILATGSRVCEPVALLELDSEEGLDIDSFADWALAEYLLRRRRILIRADASPALGMGHIYRSVALAHELGDHELVIVTRSDGEFDLGAQFLEPYPYAVRHIQDEAGVFSTIKDFTPDVVILDTLDSSLEYTSSIKALGVKLVLLEDLGEGTSVADLVINDLYTDNSPMPNHLYGVINSIVAPHFETLGPRLDPDGEVTCILISFGGSDPSNLTQKALEAVDMTGFTGLIHVALGPGYSRTLEVPSRVVSRTHIQRKVSDMADLMRKADLAITSAGRTVTELMVLGVPTLVLCQNLRELRHTHASSPFGVINLGLGDFVDHRSISEHVAAIISSHELRAEMRARSLSAVEGRSNRRIAMRILDTCV